MNVELSYRDDVSRIRGIGDRKRARLSSMGIETVGDLLDHFPFRYKNRSTVVSSDRLPEDRDVLAAGTLTVRRLRRISHGRSMVECSFRDDRGSFQVVFFNMPYMAKQLEIGTKYAVFGKIRRRNGAAVFTNPEITREGSADDIRGIIPVYRRVSGISVKEFTKWVRYALDCTAGEDDWLGEDIIRANSLCDEHYAYENIHFPADRHSFSAARFRLIYDRLLAYQYAVKKNRQDALMIDRDCSIPAADTDEFIRGLDFTLTEGQAAAVRDIEEDLSSSRPMNRLVQGDVGCGKTVVAEAAIFRTVKGGYQAAFMAPTEILARQHYSRLSDDLGNYGIRCGLLVSGMKARERAELLSGLSSGKIDVLIGTHALIQDDVEFSDLALVITDEQHRFGVNQRKALAGKSGRVNVLVMSATPIPRTLAATVFGDMDFSVIRSMPSSRRKVITRVLDGSSRGRAYAAVRKEVSEGGRAYIVAPSIDSDEDSELASAEGLFEEMKKKFRGYDVGLVHGRMDRDEKERVMDDFASGRIQILVSTVVIEVGIDVPEASIIVVENSERFGLAQLHQLRGRVGRGNRQSYCFLICCSDSENAIERMRIMKEISDGFELSEEDYRLRGAGDLMGTMQHGMASGSTYDLFGYSSILEMAGKDAEKLLTGEKIETDLRELERRVSSIYAEDNSRVI